MKCKESFDFNHYFVTVAISLGKIYGYRGNIVENGLKYIRYHENSSNDEQKSLDVIPELTMEDISNLLKAQANDYDIQHFLREKRKLIDYALRTDGQKWTQNERNKFILDNYLEFAKYLGISREKSELPIFNWIVDLENITDDEWLAIENNIKNNVIFFKLLIDCLIDLYIEGFIGEDNGRRVLKQASTRYFFRGENAIYSTSKANIFRKNDKHNSEDNQLNYFINKMRIEEFRILLNKFEVVRKWDYSDVWIEALAQHYGLPTELMDITSDLLSALFFICCKWDKEKGWLPLKKCDFEVWDSRPDVAKLGGDSRYGILYMLESEAVTFFKVQDVKPIGYQPFMRCSSQHGYCMSMTAEDDMYKNPYFRKYKIRLTESLCQWVYEINEKGRKIYPQDGLTEIQNILKLIGETNCFSKQAYDATVTALKSEIDITIIEKKLKEKDITIQKSLNFISNYRIKELNERFKVVDYENIYHFENIGRPTIIPIHK